MNRSRIGMGESIFLPAHDRIAKLQEEGDFYTRKIEQERQHKELEEWLRRRAAEEGGMQQRLVH